MHSTALVMCLKRSWSSYNFHWFRLCNGGCWAERSYCCRSSWHWVPNSPKDCRATCLAAARFLLVTSSWLLGDEHGWKLISVSRSPVVQYGLLLMHISIDELSLRTGTCVGGAIWSEGPIPSHPLPIPELRIQPEPKPTTTAVTLARGQGNNC